MVRIVLASNCLASPKGIFFRGYETEVAEEEAAMLVATGQWKRVAPPSPAPAPANTPAKPEPTDAALTSEPPAKPKREYRRVAPAVPGSRGTKP